MSCAAINAVLAACMPCGAAPASRRWVLADRIDQSRIAPGRDVSVRLGTVDARDSLGRIAHVRGVYFSVIGEFTTVDNNVAVSAYQLRGVFDAMFLQDITGHAYWPSINARDILDDTFYRHFANIQNPYLQSGVQGGPRNPTLSADYGIAADITPPATIQRRLDFYAPFVTLGPGANPLAGLIPLVALQRQSNQGAFRFRLLSEIPGSPVGITFNRTIDGLGQTGCDVWLDVVYLPALAIGPNWTLDSYTLPDQSGSLRRPEDTTEQVHIRYYPEDDPGGDATGQASVTNLDIFSLSVAGYLEMSGYAFADALQREFLFYGTERDSALTRNNASQDLPLINAANAATTLTLMPYRQRGMGAAKGSLVFKYGEMGENAWVRYNHRTVSCNEEKVAQVITKAAGCDPCSAVEMLNASGTGPGDKTDGVILVKDPAAAKGR